MFHDGDTGSRHRATRTAATVIAAYLLAQSLLLCMGPNSHTTVSAWEEHFIDDDRDVTIYGITGGIGPGDRMGSSVACGDIDNDGYDDLIMGAPYADGPSDGRIDAGEIYVIFGGPREDVGASRDVAVNANITIKVERGVFVGGNGGHIVASGDVNGDGYDDIIFAEPFQTALGRVYIVFGGPRTSLDGQTLDMYLNEWDVNISGTQTGEEAGHHLAVGDIDGDGIDDLVIGAENYRFDDISGVFNGAGRIGILYGSPGLAGTVNFNSLKGVTNCNSQQFFGHSIALGDLDGDGRDDIAVGAHKSASTGLDRPFGGQVFVFWGETEENFTTDWNLLNTPANLTINGSAGTFLGSSLGFGDINGDGRADLMAGAHGKGGAAYLFFGGGRGSMPAEWDLDVTHAHLELFGDEGGDEAGSAVAAGDLNDDGYDDMIVGAAKADGIGDSALSAGEVYVIFGNTSEALGDDKVLDSQIIYNGIDPNDYTGSSLAVGDIDADGVEDLVMGAPGGNGPENEGTDQGEVYVIYGEPRSTFIEPGVRYQGENGTFYAGYREYHLAFNLSNPNAGGAEGLDSVDIVLDPGGQDIALRWSMASGFSELSDPGDRVALLKGKSRAELTTDETSLVDFGVRFGWNFDASGPVDVELSSEGAGGFAPTGTFRDVFRVGKDLVLNGTLSAEAEYQGDIEPGSYVKGGENVTFTGLSLIYAGSPDLVPPPSAGVKAAVVDNEGDVFPAEPDPDTGAVVLRAAADPETDLEEELALVVTELPHPSVRDRTDIAFDLRVDADPPSAPPGVECWADAPGTGVRPWATHADDDTEFFVVWEDAVEGEGESGVACHAMALGDPAPAEPNASGDRVVADGPGRAEVYVRALDNVGNWGPASTASIFIDFRSLAFTSLGPSTAVWHNTTQVNATATVVDLATVPGEGSGVDPGGIYYRVSYEGDNPYTYSQWKYAGRGGQPRDSVSTWGPVIGMGEGTRNYVQWMAVDAAWSEIVLSDPYPVKVDLTAPEFSDPSPGPSRWNSGLTAEASIRVADDLAGVNASSVMYQVSVDGGGNWSAWKPAEASRRAGSAGSVTAGARVSLAEGRANLMRWLARDMAGNTAVSPEFAILADASPVAFSDFTPAEGKVQPRMAVTFSVNVSDGGSGVLASSVSYRYTSSGGDDPGGWSGWIPLTVPGEAHRPFIVVEKRLNLAWGDLNRVQVRAQDRAGTGYGESPVYTIVVNRPPVVGITSPSDGDVYEEGENITFDGGGSTDADGHPLNYTWDSTHDGLIGTGENITAPLTWGTHIVTLYIEDGYGGSASAQVVVTVIPYDSDPNPQETPAGGEGGGVDPGVTVPDDRGVEAGTAALIVAAIVAMLTLLTMFLLVFNRVMRELRREPEVAELVTDTIQLPGQVTLQLPAPAEVKEEGKEIKEAEGGGAAPVAVAKKVAESGGGRGVGDAGGPAPRPLRPIIAGKTPGEPIPTPRPMPKKEPSDWME